MAKNGGGMTKYVLKRILLMIFTMFVIMTICFMLIRIMVLPPAVFMRRNSQILSALVLITMFPKYWESSIMCVLWMISPL